MPDTQTQLQAYWAHLDELFPEIALEDAVQGATAPTPQMDRPSSRADAWWKRPLVAVVAAIILAAAIGGAAWLVGGDPAGPPVTNPPTTTAPPTTAAPPTTSPTSIPPVDSDISSGWTQVPHDPEVFGEGGGGLRAVAPGGPGLVAIGSVCSGIVDGSSVCAEGAWLSVDGLTWELAPGGDELFGQASLMDLASDGDTLVAVGMTCVMEATTPCDPGIWTSTDGIGWARAHLDPGTFAGCSTAADWQTCQTHLSSVVAGGPGFVAAGRDTLGAAIWTSADGATWERAPLGSDVFPSGADILQLLATEQRVVATGYVWEDIYEGEEWVDFTMDAQIWTSLDGIEWTTVPDDEDLFVGANIDHGVVWEGGISAIGSECDEDYSCTDITWNSPDGLTWTRTPFLSGLDLPGGIQRITAGSRGLIAIGESIDNSDDFESGEIYFWTSQDGVAWELHDADPDIFPPGSGVNEFVWHDGRLVGVGATRTDQAAGVFVWTP